MTKCPKCNADLLLEEWFERKTLNSCYVIGLYGDGDELDYEDEEEEETIEVNPVCYKCTECKEVLFDYTEDAIAFLKANPDYQDISNE